MASTKRAVDLRAGDRLLPGNEIVVGSEPDRTGKGLDISVIAPYRKTHVVWWVPLGYPFEVAAGED